MIKIIIELLLLSQAFIKLTYGDMIFEMKLNEFKNPTNRTYLNKYCSKRSDCNIGFVFCLIDLPFRNPQNCTLGDYTTPVLGGNDISFINSSDNYTYYFTIKPRTPQGIGMMVEVRDYAQNNSSWQPLDFYTSALADVPLFTRSSKTLYTIKKRFYSLFNHNTSLTVQAKLYCSKHYFGPNCEMYCNESFENFYTCDPETGIKRCKSGFVGEYCHIPDICTTLPCLNNGTCISSDGLNYTCNCARDYIGRNCELVTEKLRTAKPSVESSFKFKLSCESFNPCRHGKCYFDEKSNELACNCDSGYMGPFCDIITHPCDFKPCENGGICEIVGNLNYKCLCRPNYTGSNCQIELSPCGDYECNNGGSCFVDESGEPTCTCSDEYTGFHCEYLKNPCQSSTCQNGGTCNVRTSNNASIAECECDLHFIGDFCEKVKRTCNETQCYNGARCMEKSDFTTECECNPGYYGEYCENDVDECTLIQPCKNEGQCLNLFGSFECLCPIPYVGTTCEEKIDPCVSHPCNNNGTCRFDTANMTISCDCPKYYTGDSCEITLDICDMEIICLNNGSCIADANESSSYSCKCSEGFTGKNCENKLHICNKANPCLNGGECLKVEMNYTSDSSYTCICPKTYYGVNCENKNNCKEQPCLNEGLCTDLKNGEFKCDCNDGFFGTRCEHDIDICQFKNDICKNNGTCVDGHGASYECLCEYGYTGPICDIEVVDSNACKKAPCKNGGKCVKGVEAGTYKCECSSSYSGQNCEIENIDQCKGFCLNNGTCFINSSTMRPKCTCPKQYNGQLCENTVVLISPCASKICLNGATCRLVDNSTAQCVCKLGFAGELCETVKKCKTSDICLNNGTCVSVNSTYSYCSCTPMYTGQNCEVTMKTNNLYVNGTPSFKTLDTELGKQTTSLPSITQNINVSKHRSSIWLLIIVFGYIFGLFIIFIIIWFIWRGISYKRRQQHNFMTATSTFNLNEYSSSASVHRHSIGKQSGIMYENGVFRTDGHHDEFVNFNTFRKIQPAQRI